MDSISMNNSSNISCLAQVPASKWTSLTFWLVSCTLSLFNILIIFGNVLVILAVLKTKQMRNVNSFLITSLAFADLFVGIFVLPFSIGNETLGVWIFGRIWCQIWLAVDVWMCTASIFNLVVISFDRYIAITQPLTYPALLTNNRGKLMICGAWILSFLVGCPPMAITWPEAMEEVGNSNNKSAEPCKCTPMNNSPIYIVFSASGSFWIPTIIIITLYVKIYLIIRRVSRQLVGGYVKMGKKDLSKSMKAKYSAGISDSEKTLGSSNNNTAPPPLQSSVNEGLRIHRGGFQKSTTINLESRNTSAIIFRDYSSARGSVRFAEKGSLREPILAKRGLKHRGKSRSERQHYHPPLLRYNTITLNFPTAVETINRPKGIMGKQETAGEFHRWSSQASCATICGIPGSAQKRLARRRLYNTTPTRRRKIPAATQSPMNSVPNSLRQTTSSSLHLTGGSFGAGERQRGYQKRLMWEIQALKSVAIVTGCFMLCWMGFAVCYFLRAFTFCHGVNDCIPSLLFSIVFWLGYMNSACNPVIYALFNREFRVAFQRLLYCCGKKRGGLSNASAAGALAPFRASFYRGQLL